MIFFDEVVQSRAPRRYTRIMGITRKITNQLLEMMEEGALDPQVLAEACLAYMSESDVADMARSNELIIDSEETDEDA